MDVFSWSLNWTVSVTYIYIYLALLYQFLIDSKPLGAYARKHRWSEPAIRLKYALVDNVHIAEAA